MSAQVATSGMSGPGDVGGSMTASAAAKSDNRIFPSASTDHLDNQGDRKHHSHEEYQMRQISNDNDEGVEVVLEGSGKSSVIDSPPRPSQDQNVFRAPHPVRPRAIRGAHPGSVSHGSGSYGGYGGHPPPHSHSAPPHGDYRQHPYQPVPYAHSGSFDQQDGNVSSYPGAPPTSQYSPHVQYPPPGGRRPEDLNVISPNHKDHHAPHHGGPRHNTTRAGEPPHHPPLTPRSTGSRYPPQTSSSSYHYPPSSPVGRGAGNGASPPRVRGYGMRRPEGPYSAAQRSRDDANGSWGYPTPDRPRPPVVAESSFDSEHHYSSQVSHSSSHPTTPNASHYGGPPHQGHYSDPSPPHYGSSAYHGSFDHGASFDSHHAPYGPPSASPRHGGPGGHYEHERPYYGHSPSSHPPHQSEVSPYSYGHSPGGSNGGYYDSYSPHAPHYGRPPPRSYDEHDRYHHHYPYHPHGQYHPHYPGKKDEKSGILLPKAASEVDFDISDPPLEPSTPASKEPVCESPADINSYDVLCGRGGGTNSQVGNRRFRKLVQEFQPIYLLARRKEKPLLARTIVLVIRKRGGRFLKKDEETGELYEVGDSKAEAKTSQALREGLDVRATKSAATSLMDKKKKKSSKSQKDTSKSTSENKEDSKDEPSEVTSTSSPSENVKPEIESTPDDSSKEKEVTKDKAVVSPPGAIDVSKETEDRSCTPTKTRSESPPSLPKLNEGASASKEAASKASGEGTGPKAPPSPEQIQFRKRRRMRSADAAEPTTGTCGATNPFQGDKLFPDFCPPRADLGRTGSPPPRLSGDDVPHMDMLCGMTPVRTASKFSDDDDIRYEEDASANMNQPGCAGIALDMMTGAAAGSFCLGPRVWSKRG